MKTRLLAAVLAVAALFGAASAQAGDGNSTAGNLQGEALQVFVTPLTNMSVTMLQVPTTGVASEFINSSLAITISATIYWFEIAIVRDTATSTTGWALWSWSASTTGGMTSAAGANGAWNHQHFVKFGVEGNETVGADDELIRFGPYREGTDGKGPVRRVYPTGYVGLPPNIYNETGAVVQVRIRCGTRPYGVTPDVRNRRGSASAPVDDGVREVYVSIQIGQPFAFAGPLRVGG